MLVYGDRQHAADPRALLRRVEAGLGDLGGAGVERHGRLVGLFIEAGELAQGLADAEFEARGGDGPSPLQEVAMALVMRLARAVAASWDGGFAAKAPDMRAEIAAIDAQPLPDRVTVRTPEGYAFYALYPEAYLEAARALGGPVQAVGLRSIGTGLAAMVAVGCGGAAPVTLRPTGHPFARELRLLEPLPHAGAYAVVDEGPGLSGSSFDAVARALEGEEVVFFPSHGGEPGPEASEACRRRWARTPRRFMAFEEVVLPRLGGWFADLGEPLGPLEDLSGGAWSRGAPTDPARERRKYLLRTGAGAGAHLLKFAGLGHIGQARFERAQALHAAGFCPEPLMLRHGFMAERWHAEARPLTPSDRPALLDRLGRYLAFRAQAFPADDDAGATLEELAKVAEANAGVRLEPPDLPVRRVHVDGRLHAWEWLVLPDGDIVKTDAVDHSETHDLVGCQDIAWDVAGATVEFALSPAEVSGLSEAAGADPRLVVFYGPCYAAFQLGLWTLAGNGRQAARYQAATGCEALRPAPTGFSA